ncbi:MAG: GGDEF domain-containing protein [Pirellulales bacterium]
MARDLEGVGGRLRNVVAQNSCAIRRFATRLMRFERAKAVSRAELCDRAEELLKPTNQLQTEISRAYAQLFQQMSHLATFAELRTDPLTGTTNRQALDETLAKLLAVQPRHGLGLSLAMIDIDFFKQLNESRNLLEGDRTLVELVSVLRGSIRQCDLLARYGGEEFVIVMPHTELRWAANLAERIRERVQRKMSITVSIGVAASVHGDSPATLFARTETAVAKAKAAGRNCVALHDGADGRIVGDSDQPREAARPARPANRGAQTATLNKTAVNLERKRAAGAAPSGDDAEAAELAATS